MKIHLAVLAIIAAASCSTMAISKLNVEDAKVVTVTTTAATGYLSIANGRNCLRGIARGKPAC